MLRKLFFIFLAFTSSIILAQSNRYIDVTGTSELNIEADQIEFSLTIYTHNETLKQSKEENDVVRTKLLNMINSFENSLDDIQVSPLSFGIYYEFEDNRRVEAGYYTSTQVDFKLVEIDMYFSLLDNLTTIENTSISRTNYNNSQYEKYNQAAYENALFAAKQKAEYMANTLSVKLGAVLEIEDNSNLGIGPGQGYPNPFNTSSTVKSNSDNFFGAITINRKVRVKYKLVDQ